MAEPQHSTEHTITSPLQAAARLVNAGSSPGAAASVLMCLSAGSMAILSVAERQT